MRVRAGARDVEWSSAGLGIAGVLAALLLPFLAACATGGSDEGEGEGGPPPKKLVTIHVQNRNWRAIHFYVQSDAGAHRSLGQLASGDTATYQVGREIVGGVQELQLIADPIGVRGVFSSEPILFNWGDLITWNVQQPLTHSSVFVR